VNAASPPRGRPDAFADGHRLDGGDRHERRRETPVQPAVRARQRPEPRRHPARDHLERAPDRVLRAPGRVDRPDHPPLRRGVGAAQRRGFRETGDAGERDLPGVRDRDLADRHGVRRDLDPDLGEKRLRDRADARPASSSPRALARSRMSRASWVPYFSAPARSAWPGLGRRTRRARSPRGASPPHRHRCAPVLEVDVGDEDGDGASEGASEADAPDDPRAVLLDAHPPAPAVAALASRDRSASILLLRERQPRGHALEDGGQAGPVRLPCRRVPQHRGAMLTHAGSAPSRHPRPLRPWRAERPWRGRPVIAAMDRPGAAQPGVVKAGPGFSGQTDPKQPGHPHTPSALGATHPPRPRRD
jgi:hypothetical protein